MDLTDRLIQAKKIARETLPRYKGLFDSLGFVIGDYPSFGIDLNSMVVLCPEKNKWSIDELAFMWAHEILHFYRGDAYIMDLMKEECKHRWHIACDLSINTFLERLGMVLPKTVYLPKKYAFPDGLTAYDYYDRLEGIL